ncbi:MAG: exosortase/archaeosortase family protein [Verrucomicrobiota bacterium]|nr:exosortase/archaeosortase family protein [Verrucomicrobiota bacterium]
MQKFKAWWSGFHWSPLSAAAKRELAFWAVVIGGLFFMFHLHGNTQEVASARHSIFLWLRTRWVGDYAYCQFLPLASLAAVWLRRKQIARAEKHVDFRAVPILLLGLFLHWIGVLAQQPRISVAGFIILLWGLPFLFYGYGVARHLLFACGYLFLAIPLNFIDSMTAPLRLFATHVSAGFLNGIGIEVVRVGSGLFSPDNSKFSFNVAPECSGLRSLLAMTALIAFYSWYSQKTLAKKWILFLCSIPIAIVANICRIVLVVLIGAFFGQETAMGLWHDYSGYPIFLISIALVLLVDRLLNTDYRNAWIKIKNLFLSRASS